MLCTIRSAGLDGFSPYLVRVEVDVSSMGLPYTHIVGLANKEIQESKERIRSALRNVGISIRAKKTLINLSPSTIPKSGPSYDLPIALGILVANGLIPPLLQNTLVFGGLGLNGEIRGVGGATALIYLAKKVGYTNLYVPKDNEGDILPQQTGSIFLCSHLLEIIAHLRNEKKLVPFAPSQKSTQKVAQLDPPFISGNGVAKRATAIAAAGGHHCFLLGSPGRGKTLLSTYLHALMPPLSQENIEEVSAVYSAGGQDAAQLQHGIPPFLTIYPTSPPSVVFGSMAKKQPGQLLLAHHGIVYADEFAEFPSALLHTLKPCIEYGILPLRSGVRSIPHHSRFLLFATANPCPCGYRYSTTKRCACSAADIRRYANKLKHAVMERIDLHLFIHEESFHLEKGDERTQKLEFEKLKNQVLAAQLLQKQRFTGAHISANGEMQSGEVQKYCRFTTEAQTTLDTAADLHHLSPRRYVILARVAQTIADMEQKLHIEKHHITEAMGYCIPTQ
ncbi:MAG TPA: hypothetical protein DCX25_02995 [Candidatus Pacebacteria bacterium]|nr:MAG: Mg chelatase-related protein [Microgenomates group bacterium GW2011_GWB1_45_17]KKU23683.1 MAG: Mg chelatase-related protein [Microgenomates group bacterium GW2011_GWA1_46_15]KKU24584.1 MAG: Mg chelatase-related protein [Microgenomates group bacterium GW2011_GWC1_46_15]HAV15270.1 hypothetical protein [Candidatus Paceibacterota bacterium]HCR10985.1 hypothetical protein [Candidatus Paceibacterota bacterium]